MDDLRKKNEKFDAVAFALVQALSPDKRLSRDQIPYAQLRTLVSEFVGKQVSQHYNGRLGGGEQRTSKRGDRSGADEPPTTSGGRRSSLSLSCVDESDDNSNSRMSFENNFSVRTQTLVRVASEKALASISSSSSSSNVVFAGMKPNSSRVRREIRKVQELRARRREARKCSEVVEFKGEEPELPNPVNKLYHRLLAEKRCSLHCFQVLTNSITNFYRPRTWTDNVEKVTGTFLRKYILKTSDRLCEEYDQQTTVDQDKRLIEYETQILIELYALRFADDIPLENSSIVNKFRFIYFTAEPGRMKTFLDETVADEFSAVMPTTIAQIYEELCVTIPSDLKEFAAEHEEQPVDSLFVENQKRMMANKHLQALDRVLEEDAEEVRAKSSRCDSLKKRKKSIEERKKKRASCRSLMFSKDDEGGKITRRLSVPETPDYKLNRKRQKDQCVDDNSNGDMNGEVVVQTPLAKMRRSAKIGARQSPRQHASTREISKRKVSLLLNNIETKQAKTTDNHVGKSPVRQAKAPPKRMNKEDFLQNLLNSGSSEKKRSKDGSPDKTPVRFAVDERPKERAKDGKRNLLKRHFSETNGSPTAADKTWSSSISLDCDSAGHAVPIIKLSRDGRATYSSQVSTKVAKVEDDDYTVTPAAVERYRKRIDKIRAAKYRGIQQENEVFYGRGTSRINLFEEAEAVAAAKSSSGTSMVTRSNGNTDPQSQTQRNQKTAKNRQGRSVAYKSAGCFYMAHALLNVKNDRPLSPVIPKAMAQKFKSPFKLQRLLRRPSRARRRALAKQKAADASDASSMKTESSSSRSDSSLRLSVSVETRKLETLVADVTPADRSRIERTLLLSPRTNGRLKSAEHVDWASAGTRSRPRSFSISEFPNCPSPPRRISIHGE